LESVGFCCFLTEASQPASQPAAAPVQALPEQSQHAWTWQNHLLGKLATSQQGVKALCATDSVQSHACCCCCCCGCFNQLLFNKNGSTHDLVPPPPPSLCLSCSSGVCFTSVVLKEENLPTCIFCLHLV